MTSLKETWHRHRQQRQQEIRHRQQQVHSTLTQFSLERQMQAEELRQSLDAFQQQLQQETQILLADLAARREANAPILMQQLRDFTRSLSEEVADFLAQTADDRLSNAEALWQSLDEFHQNLGFTVADLRQQLQRQIETIQAETCEFLEISEQTRWQNQMQLQQMLQQNRQQRQAEMEQLHRQFAILRSERAAFCAQLRQHVWGSSAPVMPFAAIVPGAAMTPIASTARSTRTRSSATAGKKQAVQNSSPAPVRTTARTATRTTPRTSATTRTAAKAPQPKLNPLEQTIFDHLQQVHKATLTEIQSQFGINRFAAVDVLRALIKKGCVTQRDRFYLA